MSYGFVTDTFRQHSRWECHNDRRQYRESGAKWPHSNPHKRHNLRHTPRLTDERARLWPTDSQTETRFSSGMFGSARPPSESPSSNRLPINFFFSVSFLLFFIFFISPLLTIFGLFSFWFNSETGRSYVKTFFFCLTPISGLESINRPYSYVNI